MHIFTTCFLKAHGNLRKTQDFSISPHMTNDVVGELGAFTESGAFHLAFEVVGDGSGSDGAVDSLDDEVGGFVPGHVAEHHFARQDE